MSDQIIVIFCPDCCGKFEVENADIVEGEILECELCAAEILVEQQDPVRLKLYSEDDELL